MRGMMTPGFVVKALAKNMESGDMLKFGYEYDSNSRWRFALTKVDCEPYTVSLTGRKMGTHETWSRRYLTVEAALLHVANRLNENSAIKNPYSSMDEWMKMTLKQHEN